MVCKMLVILKEKADANTLKRVAEDLDGYVKVVVDINRNILSAGGKLHVDGEKLLLENTLELKVFVMFMKN